MDVEPSGISKLSLCTLCREIDFGALRCPTYAQLHSLSLGEDIYPPGLFDAVEAYHMPIPLGTLHRIKHSAPHCRSCRLIWSVIIRDNSHEEPPLNDPDNQDREQECFAQIFPYAQFFPRKQEDSEIELHHKANVVRRLSLRIGCPAVDDDYEDDFELWWNIHFCIQATASAPSCLPPEMAFLSSSEGIFAYGGRQRPLVADLAWIRQWYQICGAEHHSTCSIQQHEEVHSEHSETGPQDKPFADFTEIRLINVDLNCIERFEKSPARTETWPPAYIALSYVWGYDQPLKLLSDNEQCLMLPCALLLRKPSKTIVDAATLVQRLNLEGIRHLWVDALCILQDSDEDKRRQLGSMDRIYADAALTIVAAVGGDAEHGLPGLHSGTRTTQQSCVEIIPPSYGTVGDGGFIVHEHGLAIMDTLTPLPNRGWDFWELDKYATRGWTMQERVLSRRRLIFTADQVYWQCASATFCEESHMESRVSDHRLVYNGATREEPFQQTVQLLRGQKMQPLNSDQLLHHLTHTSRVSNTSFWERLGELATGYSQLKFTNEGDMLDGFSGVLDAVSRASSETFLWALPISRFTSALMWTHNHDDFVRRRMAPTTLPVTALQKRVLIPSWSWLAWESARVRFTGNSEGLRTSELLCYVHQPGGRSLHLIEDQETTQAGAHLSRSSEKQCDYAFNREVTMESIRLALPALHNDLPFVPEGTLLFFWTSLAHFRIEFYEPRNESRILTTKPSLSEQSTAWRFSKVEPIGGVDHYFVGKMDSGTDSTFARSFPFFCDDEDVYEFIVLGRQNYGYAEYLVVMAIRRQGLGVAVRIGVGTISVEAWLANNPRWRLIACG